MVEVASCIPVKFRSAFICMVHSHSPSLRATASTCACVPIRNVILKLGKRRVAPHAAAQRASKPRRHGVVSFAILIMVAAVAVEASTFVDGRKMEQEKNRILSCNGLKGPISLFCPAFSGSSSPLSDHLTNCLLHCFRAASPTNPLIRHFAGLVFFITQVC
jgi:hypothetical protein